MKNEHLFFSIVIPAHNEANYIEDTLMHIAALDYPKDRFEVVIVENGSTDNTYELAKKFEENHIVVLNPALRGVSKARNHGIDRVHRDSSWVIFLDADTILKKDFLKDFNAFIQKKEAQNAAGRNGKNIRPYVTGTTTVKPLSGTTNAKLWFAFYDLGHKLTKASYSIHFIKRSLLDKIRYDEEIHAGEDLKLIRDSLKIAKGKFLFFPTDQVWTSTRRFDQEGWWKIFFSWTLVGALPPSIRKRFNYKVVR